MYDYAIERDTEKEKENFAIKIVTDDDDHDNNNNTGTIKTDEKTIRSYEERRKKLRT